MEKGKSTNCFVTVLFITLNLVKYYTTSRNAAIMSHISSVDLIIVLWILEDTALTIFHYCGDLGSHPHKILCIMMLSDIGKQQAKLLKGTTSVGPQVQTFIIFTFYRQSLDPSIPESCTSLVYERELSASVLSPSSSCHAQP